jgi:hypothetical protein
LHKLDEWRFQVSGNSTDTAIRELFHKAMNKQITFDENESTWMLRACVLLDETSLSANENLLIKETHDLFGIYFLSPI